MKQKVIKVGNSLAVTVPAGYVREMNLKAGDTIDFSLVKESSGVYENTRENITPEFKEWLDEIEKDYAGAIKKLANINK